MITCNLGLVTKEETSDCYYQARQVPKIGLSWNNRSNENHTKNSIGDHLESPPLHLIMGEVRVAKFILRYKGLNKTEILEYMGE